MNLWASLVVQWLRVCLPMQGLWVLSLVWEDSTCCRGTNPVCHNYWARALEPILGNKKSHHNEKPMNCNEEYPPLITTRESLHEDLEQPEVSKLIKKQNKTALRDFPGGPVVKNPPANAGARVRSLLWEDPKGQLSLCTTTTKPILPWATTTEPVLPWATTIESCMP